MFGLLWLVDFVVWWLSLRVDVGVGGLVSEFAFGPFNCLHCVILR